MFHRHAGPVRSGGGPGLAGCRCGDGRRGRPLRSGGGGRRDRRGGEGQRADLTSRCRRGAGRRGLTRRGGRGRRAVGTRGGADRLRRPGRGGGQRGQGDRRRSGRTGEGGRRPAQRADQQRRGRHEQRRVGPRPGDRRRRGGRRDRADPRRAHSTSLRDETRGGGRNRLPGIAGGVEVVVGGTEERSSHGDQRRWQQVQREGCRRSPVFQLVKHQSKRSASGGGEENMMVSSPMSLTTNLELGKRFTRETTPTNQRPPLKQERA